MASPSELSSLPLRGSVVHFDPEKGCGFIRPDAPMEGFPEGKDVYFRRDFARATTAGVAPEDIAGRKVAFKLNDKFTEKPR